MLGSRITGISGLPMSPENPKRVSFPFSFISRLIPAEPRICPASRQVAVTFGTTSVALSYCIPIKLLIASSTSSSV